MSGVVPVVEQSVVIVPVVVERSVVIVSVVAEQAVVSALEFEQAESVLEFEPVDSERFAEAD